MLAVCLPASAERVAVPLNDYQRLGQRFTADRPFDTLWVTVPSWLDTEGGLTLTVWDSPARARRLASRAFTGIADNQQVRLRIGRLLPAGAYYWEVDARTGATLVGLYADALAAETDDCAYLDGVPDRRRRFVFAIGTLDRPRPSIPQLIAALRPDASDQEKSDACRELAIWGDASAVPALARLLDDPDLSHMARFALEAMPGARVNAALRAATLRLTGAPLVGVVNTLGVRRDAGAVPRLSALLRSADASVAAAAAVALGRIGTPASIDALLRAPDSLDPAVSAAVREGLLASADGLLAAGRRGRAIALYDRLRAPSAPPAMRVAATRGAIVARGAAGAELLVQQLRAGDERLAGAALWVAQRELPGAGVTAALTAALPGLTDERRVLLVRALGRRGDRSVAPTLEAATASGPIAVRVAALRALADMGGGAAVPAFVRALADPDAEISRAAQDALATLPRDEAATVAAALLRAPDPRSRLAAIDLALLQRMPKLVPDLAAAARDPDSGVRVAALRSLGELAMPDDLPRVIDALVAAPEGPELTAAGESLAAASERASEPEQAVDRLAGAMGRGGAPHRIAILRALGSLGGPRALEAVRGALRGPDGVVSRAAFEVLCQWKGAEAAPDLLQIATTAQAPAERTQALRGLLRMAADAELPADRRLAICRDAGPIVQRDEERRLLLGALGGLGTPEALALALPHLAAPATREEAAIAILGIAERLAGGPDRAAAAEALERVAAAGVSAELAARANALLQQARGV